MRRRIRVLQVVNNLNYGGMERLIAGIARRTDPSRFEMHVMALHYLGHFATGLDEFATLHTARPMSKWSMLRPTSLAADIARIAPDVMHLHSGTWYKASLAAQLAGVRFQVYTDHGRQKPDPWRNRKLDRAASARTDVVVAVSEKLAEHMARFVSDPGKIRVVANGVDTEQYTPRAPDDTLRAELDIGADNPIIGSVGRLERVKGYAVMMDAFVHLMAEWAGGPPPVLVIVGDGSERADLERAAQNANLTSNVRFLGWRSDIERCASVFTVFSMSSHSEGTSVSLLEAMSAGLCPVVTDVGGNAAVLGESLRHRLVEPGNPHALAAAWRDALTDATTRERDAAAARARVVERFGLAAMVRQYEAIYASSRQTA